MFARYITRIRIKGTLAVMALSGVVAGLIILARSCDSNGCDPFVFYAAVWLIAVVGLLSLVAWRNT